MVDSVRAMGYSDSVARTDGVLFLAAWQVEVLVGEAGGDAARGVRSRKPIWIRKGS